jgi:hypothetical protein
MTDPVTSQVAAGTCEYGTGSIGDSDMHPTDQWQSLAGTIVEVTRNGELHRRGFVDAALADGSGFWLASDGTDTRKFIDKASGYEAWTALYPPSRYA